MKNIKKYFNGLFTAYFLILGINIIYAASQTNIDLQKFKITAIAETRKVPLNQQFNVTISVSYIGQPGDYIITAPYVEKYHNLELVGNSTESLVKTSTENSNIKEVIKNYVFILKPRSLGQAYFPIVRITVSDKKGNLLNEIATQPITIIVEEPVVKKDYSTLFLVIIIILIISGAGLFIIYIIRQKKKKEKKKRLEEERIKIRKTPEDEFFEEFKNVFSLKDIEKLSFAINTLKKYFQKKFKHNFKDKSTNELINYFKEKKLINSELIDNLTGILNESDLIKFAAEKPDSKKITKMLNNIENLFNSIKGGLKDGQGDKGN